MTIERNIYITEGYQPLRDDKFYYTLMYPAVFAAGPFLFDQLICRGSIPIDFIVTNRVTVLTAAIAGIAFDGVDTAILHFLHDANMIGRTVLTSIIPIKKDNIACRWLIASALPLPIATKPVHTVRTKGKFRYDAAVQIAALVGTP